ncbi:hypothetical protein DITRI_Ditri07aG0033100 [Diplodiscus trichospermus]
MGSSSSRLGSNTSRRRLNRRPVQKSKISFSVHVRNGIRVFWVLFLVDWGVKEDMENISSSRGAAAAAKISSIFIYPIKSCRGISVPLAPLTPTGFRWDRHWLVVNQKGRAYTQRVEPKLALVEVELPNEAFSEAWEPTKNS